MNMFGKYAVSAACLMVIVGWNTPSSADEVTGKITKLREGSDAYGNLRVRLRSKDGSKIRLRFKVNEGNEAIIDGKAAQPRDLKVGMRCTATYKVKFRKKRKDLNLVSRLSCASK